MKRRHFTTYFLVNALVLMALATSCKRPAETATKSSDGKTPTVIRPETYAGLDQDGLAMVAGPVTWRAQPYPVKIIKVSVIDHETQTPVAGVSLQVKRASADNRPLRDVVALPMIKGHQASILIREDKSSLKDGKITVLVAAKGFRAEAKDIFLDGAAPNSDMDYPIALWREGEGAGDAGEDVPDAALDQVEGRIRFEKTTPNLAILGSAFLVADDRQVFPQDIRLGFAAPTLYDEVRAKVGGQRVTLLGTWQNDSRPRSDVEGGSAEDVAPEYFIVERYRLIAAEANDR